MSLVGDVILSARELIPDLPQVLPSPASAPSASVVSVTGSTLPAGNYFLVCSFRTPWGETRPSAEISAALTVGASQGIQITAPSLPPSASAIRVYLTLPGGASESEQQFIESSVVPFTISTPPTATGLPATRNSAYLPDTDGLRMFSAGTVYRWLNQGLSRATRKVGGIQDYTGCASVSGQALYVLTGEWSKIQSVWYDGFPLALGNQRAFYRYNRISSSVLAACNVSVRDNRVILEVFYQPARTSGSTTLSSAMLSTDTVASLTSAAGFQTFAPPMFAQIGSEVVALSAIGSNQLQNLIRGIGGTTPQAWPTGTAVKELNIWILGKRLSTPTYAPGNSLNTLPVPLGWEQVLPDFMLSRSRFGEQEDQKAQGFLKQFDDAVADFLRANRQIAGPTQAGNWTMGAETVPGFGTSGGGVVLP